MLKLILLLTSAVLLSSCYEETVVERRHHHNVSDVSGGPYYSDGYHQHHRYHDGYNDGYYNDRPTVYRTNREPYYGAPVHRRVVVGF